MGKLKERSKEMRFHQVGEFERNEIGKIKWMTNSIEHLAILTESNSFLIFDLNESLDIPELSIDFSPETPKFTDFSFSEPRDFSDFSSFTVFFLSGSGEIFFLQPFLLRSSFVSKLDFDCLKERVCLDDGIAAESRISIDRYISYMENESVFLEGKYYLKGSLGVDKIIVEKV